MCISTLSRLSHKNFNFKPYTFGKTSSKGNTNTVVRFLVLVTTMVTKVDHGNHRSNDRGNHRSNHRGYYDGYYNGNT